MQRAPPHFLFYIGKVGFAGVYIVSLIFAQNIECECVLEPPQWGGSNKHPQSMFGTIDKKSATNFILKGAVYWAMKDSIKLHRYGNVT